MVKLTFLQSEDGYQRPGDIGTQDTKSSVADAHGIVGSLNDVANVVLVEVSCSPAIPDASWDYWDSKFLVLVLVPVVSQLAAAQMCDQSIYAVIDSQSPGARDIPPGAFPQLAGSLPNRATSSASSRLGFAK